MLIKKSILLIFLLVFLASCSGAAPKSESTPTAIPTPVIPPKPTYKVQRGDIEQNLKFTGRVVPVVEEALYFGVGGRVDEVFAQQGDPVKAGRSLPSSNRGTVSLTSNEPRFTWKWLKWHWK